MSRFAFRRAQIVEPVETPPEEPLGAEPVPALTVEEPPAPPPPVLDNSMLDRRLKLHSKLIDEIDLSKLDKLEEGEMRRQLRKLTGAFARAESLALTGQETGPRRGEAC